MRLLLLVTVAGVLSGHPIEKVFTSGETLDYQLSWFGITAGTARMTIAPATDDLNRFRITSSAHSSSGFSRIVHVRDQIETIVARSDFSTLRYVKRLDERGDRSVEVTTIENGVATRTRRKVVKVAVPRPVFDPISVIFYVRALDLSPGRSHQFTLISDGKIYSVHARVQRRERVRTPAGVFDAVLVEPQMSSGGVPREEKLSIWYTDDEKRIPVRIRTEVAFGSVVASLRMVASGVTSIDPSEVQGE